MAIERIKEPTNVSEFEVHAYVWTELRKLGINARGEVKVKYNDPRQPRAVCRFDIGVFQEGYLAGIIEIKSRPIQHKSDAGWVGTRQGSRYMTFGVPVELIYGQAEAERFIELTKDAGKIVWG